MNNLNTFADTAKKLARNPLGIIALFIVLIYGIACLTFANSKSLSDLAIGFFIAFILIYPLIILFVFYRLVTKHHTKLYAPEDFPIREDFIKCAYGDQSRPGITLDEARKQKSETPKTANEKEK